MSDHSKKPAWFVITASFGILIISILGYFFIHAYLAQKSFKAHINETTQLVTEILTLNTETAVKSRQVVEDIIELFLINTATFIDYLDSVEPFTDSELIAFSIESGLSGVTILSSEGDILSSTSWEKTNSAPPRTNMKGELFFSESKKFYRLSHMRKNKPGYILLSHPASGLSALQKEIGIEKLLKILDELPGFTYVKRVKSNSGQNPGEIKFVVRDGKKIVETRISIGREEIVAGLSSDEYFRRIDQIWQQVALFSILTALLGIFFSILVYYYQKKHLQKVQNHERNMAKDKEDAAIGRASATITHEIRNPINAISIGLQRLQIEETGLAPDHLALIEAMLKAVTRTNSIITELNRYALPVKPQFNDFFPDAAIVSILSLYKKTCSENKIRIDYHKDFEGIISADATLMETVIDNLILNAIEAQPDGGFIDIRLFCLNNSLLISLSNSGFKNADPAKLSEPYYTTKTTGSGLGLAVAAKIIHAHNGKLLFETAKPDIIRTSISLPLTTGEDRRTGVK